MRRAHSTSIRVRLKGRPWLLWWITVEAEKLQITKEQFIISVLLDAIPPEKLKQLMQDSEV